MSKYILFTAEKFGYGPVITCLNIAHELKKTVLKLGIKMIFLGTSIAKEQATKSKIFDEVIECKTYDYKELELKKDLFMNASAILCSENQFGAIFATKLGLKNVFFVDNLVWMWDKITPGLEGVRVYFISETIDSRENFKRIGGNIKNPIFVGPLREIEIGDCPSENNLLINFGGAESFMLDKTTVVKFYRKILSEILTSNVKEKFNKIYVCGGSGVINKLKDFSSSKISIQSLSNKEYLKKLHMDSHIIMSSGLGNFVESIGINKNIFYLPPINYSQLLQLDCYKKLDLGLRLVNWSDYSFYKDVPSFLDEEKGVQSVVENVDKYLLSDENLLSDAVNEFIRSPQEKYFKKRAEYISKFPKNSSKIVADYIINSLGGC